MAIIDEKILYDKSLSMREAAKIMGVCVTYVYNKRHEYAEKHNINWKRKIELDEEEMKLLEDQTLSANDITLILLDRGKNISLSTITALRKKLKLNRARGNVAGYAKVYKLFTEEEIYEVIKTANSKAEGCRKLKCSPYSYNKLKKKYDEKMAQSVNNNK